MTGSVCVLTVHGIGFQQPPTDQRPGYADTLHENLRAPLGDRLGDDPNRKKGPVYVVSEVDGSRTDGLARLDPSKPLAQAGRIAHVALVYSPSEPLEPRPGSTADTIARAVLAHGHYVSALGALRLVLGDAWAALHQVSRPERESSLVPRDDLPVDHHRGRFAELLHRHHHEPDAAKPLGILRALEDDVATYVCRNDLRERVRGFVQEALLRVLQRNDVEAVVVNAHSQGTVICWDVLCRLPFFSWKTGHDPRAEMIPYFVTAGSPIRKYVDLFAWGERVGQMAASKGDGDPPLAWRNYWDPKDPVADPLDPPASWRPGGEESVQAPDELGLLVAIDPDSGAHRHYTVLDKRVDNIHNSSGGGLQAHDYWNNKREFIPALAKLLG